MEKNERSEKAAVAVNTPVTISLCCKKEIRDSFMSAWKEITEWQKACQLITDYSPDAQGVIADADSIFALPTEWNRSCLLFLLDEPISSLWRDRAEYVFLPPYGYEAILRHVFRLLGKSVQTPSKSLIRRQAKVCLESLCIPSRLLGHKYLTEGILLLFSEPYPGRPGLLQKIYAHIARQYNSSPVMVDRAIRHGVEVCWKKSAPDKLKSIFGYDSHDLLCTPTNGEFLYALYEHLRLLLYPTRGEAAFQEQLRFIAQRHGIEE